MSLERGPGVRRAYHVIDKNSTIYLKFANFSTILKFSLLAPFSFFEKKKNLACTSTGM